MSPHSVNVGGIVTQTVLKRNQKRNGWVSLSSVRQIFPPTLVPRPIVEFDERGKICLTIGDVATAPIAGFFVDPERHRFHFRGCNLFGVFALESKETVEHNQQNTSGHVARVAQPFIVTVEDAEFPQDLRSTYTYRC